MSTAFDALNFLEKFKIQDGLLEESYEEVPASERALIKQAIAFHFSMHKTRYEEEVSIINRHSGYSIKKKMKASPYLVCVLLGEFSSPARLLSILCPAVLAGVEQVYIFANKDSDAKVWATLELCGMENVFVFEDDMQSKEMSLQCVQNLAQNNFEKGRFLILGDESDKNIYLATFEQVISNHNVDLFVDVYSPKVITLPQNQNALIWGYGISNSFLWEESSIASEVNLIDVSFVPEVEAKQNYQEGLECCYLHPNVDVDYFMNTKVYIGQEGILNN